MSNGTKDDLLHASAISSRLATHLGEIAAHASDVEAVISSALDAAGPISPENLRTIQKLDYVRQAIEDTARLVAWMTMSPNGEISELRQTLNLGRTVALLDDYSDMGIPEEECPGSLQLF